MRENIGYFLCPTDRRYWKKLASQSRIRGWNIMDIVGAVREKQKKRDSETLFMATLFHDLH